MVLLRIAEHVALDDALDVRYREQQRAEQSREHLENEFASLVYDGLLDIYLHAAKADAKSKPKPTPRPKPRPKLNGPRTKPKVKPKTKSDDHAKTHCWWLVTNLFAYMSEHQEFLEVPHLEKYKQDVIEKALIDYVNDDVLSADALHHLQSLLHILVGANTVDVMDKYIDEMVEYFYGKPGNKHDINKHFIFEGDLASSTPKQASGAMHESSSSRSKESLPQAKNQSSSVNTSIVMGGQIHHSPDCCAKQSQSSRAKHYWRLVGRARLATRKVAVVGAHSEALELVRIARYIAATRDCLTSTVYFRRPLRWGAHNTNRTYLFIVFFIVYPYATSIEGD
jgi:hypothetical protein